MNKDNEFDDIFKRGLEDPVDEPGFREGDWDAMEQMLDRQKRRGLVFWLPILGSAAALLLLFLGWWAFSTKTTGSGTQTIAHTSPKQQQEHTGTGGGPIRQNTEPKQNTALAAGYAATPVKGTGSSKSNAFLPQSAAGSRRDTTGLHGVAVPAINGSMAQNGLVSAQGDSNQPAETLSATYGSLASVRFAVNAPGVSTARVSAPAANGSSTSKNGRLNPKNGFRPQYAISLIGAPDLNGVGAIGQGKVGTNVGLLFSAGVLKRFTLSTGVIYSAKPYNTSFEDYHTPYKFPVEPTNVTADCRMFDIPLDIDYLVYNKHQNHISFGTGLSSYLMVHQNYVFNYAYPYTIGPANYTVKDNGKYFFGVLNLNATYHRQLNSRLGFSVEPYLKLPLTNVGYSEVRLQSTGLAIGLSYSLNSLIKPTEK